MTPYQAMMAAADHIETNPHRFHFDHCDQPGHLRYGSPGCALGWIAFFSQAPRDDCGCFDIRAIHAIYGEAIPCETDFYFRMDELEDKEDDDDSDWRDNPKACAELLRKYAQKYVAPAPLAVGCDRNLAEALLHV